MFAVSASETLFRQLRVVDLEGDMLTSTMLSQLLTHIPQVKHLRFEAFALDTLRPFHDAGTSGYLASLTHLTLGAPLDRSQQPQQQQQHAAVLEREFTYLAALPRLCNITLYRHLCTEEEEDDWRPRSSELVRCMSRATAIDFPPQITRVLHLSGAL